MLARFSRPRLLPPRSSRTGPLAGKSSKRGRASTARAECRRAQKRLAIPANPANPPAVKRLVLLLGAVAFAASVATAAEIKSELRTKAEAGDAKAQVELGKAYHFGTGVIMDRAEAVKWFRRAAEQGAATAQTILGLYYELGLAVEKDPVEAVRWYLKAAAQGDANAQINLGFSYSNGVGAPKD